MGELHVTVYYILIDGHWKEFHPTLDLLNRMPCGCHSSFPLTGTL